MRKHNTFLKIFGVLILVLLGTSWAFLHSRAFGRLLSKAITEVSSKKFDTKVRFNQVSVRFFPPGIALEGVRFVYAKDGTKIEAQAGELGVAFDFHIFSGKRTRIREIFLREGWAHLEIPKSESSGQHPWDQIQNELAKLPVVVDTLSVEDSRIESMGVSLDISNLKTRIGSKEIHFEGEVKDLSYEKVENHLDLLKIEATLRRDELLLDQWTVLQKRSLISGSGKLAHWSDLEAMEFEGPFKTDLYVADVKEALNLDPVHLEGGLLAAKGQASWSKAKGPLASFDFELTNFRSNIIYGKHIQGKIRTDGNRVTIDQYKFENDDERMELLRPAVIWNQSTKKLFPDGLKVVTQKLDLHNALRFLGKSLEPLRGLVTGELDFYLHGVDMEFIPKDGVKLENIGIRVTKDNGEVFDVVRAPVLWLSKTEMAVDKGVFSMHGVIKGPQTQVEVAGSVGKDEVHFDVGPGPLSFADLGNVADLGLKGGGLNEIRVRGPLDHVTMLVLGEFKKFEVLGYRLGDTKHQLLIDLGKSKVDFQSFNAKKGRYGYNGTGVVQWKDFLMDLSIELPQISYTEFKDAIHPLEGGLDWLPPDFEGTLQGNVELLAKKDIKNLAVAADVYAQKLVAYGESFRDAKFAFLYKNKQIRLDGFSITKETGRATGQVSYNMPDSRIDYNLSLRGLPSNELSYYKRLPFALEFKAVGEFQGWRTPTLWHHRGFLGLSNSRVLDESLPDSTFEWDLRHDGVQLDAKVAEDWIVLNAQSLPSSKGAHIDAKLDVNIPNLPLVMMGIFGENPQLTNASGSMAMEARVGVSNWEWHRLDLKAWLKSINLKTPETNLEASFGAPQLAIESGRINRWDFRLNGADLRVDSHAEGDLRNRLVLKNNFDFDAKYLEILTAHLQRAEGRVMAGLKMTLSQNDLKVDMASNAQGLTIGTDLLPFALSNLQYDVNYSDNELEINQLSFRPDSGVVKMNGSMTFGGVDPDVNLRWFMEQAVIPIKNRSHLTLTGNGMIFGSQRPYALSGDLAITKGTVLNEITDFTSDRTSTTDTKYLPREVGGAAAGLVSLDLAVHTENPVNVSNSLIDVFLAGDMQLHGEMLRPTADGRVSVAGNSSRVFFKNSEYQIVKGDFLFNGRKAITKPDFDVAATATINNYKVTAKAFGNPDNFTFDLGSEPALSKQNILSLIAFGYTDDLSNSISPEERQNLTNVGVGSFIFDQFKVTDIVKKQFGLQVNMGTVFVPTNNSLLSNRQQDTGGAGSLARTRTATNIEIKKRLSEAMSLSVSSTVGGSIGQRQRMNLNYGLTRSVQLEGIYELRTNADGQEDVIDNSIGGDVKFRMTFR